MRSLAANIWKSCALPLALGKFGTITSDDWHQVVLLLEAGQQSLHMCRDAVGGNRILTHLGGGRQCAEPNLRRAKAARICNSISIRSFSRDRP